MKTQTKNNKQINLALIAMAVIFFGTEIIITIVSKDSYRTNQIRPWFAILVGIIYYVLAHQILENNKTKNHEKLQNNSKNSAN